VAGLFAIVFFAAIFGVFKPYINGVSRGRFGIVAFISFVLIGLTAPKSSPPNKTVQGPEKAASSTASTPSESNGAIAQDVKPEETTEWTYESRKDEMRGSEDKYAIVNAGEPISLDFPYGQQTGQIIIRKSPKFGFDIMVGVPSGQIMCNSFQNTYISVKFDSGPVQRYSCTDAADGSSNMVFVQGAKGFLAKLKKSKKLSSRLISLKTVANR
jgi:hypothetical protein